MRDPKDCRRHEVGDRVRGDKEDGVGVIKKVGKADGPYPGWAYVVFQKSGRVGYIAPREGKVCNDT